MTGINVLSLFDGMSCGQIALERANVKVANYYASEIDRFAIQIALKNYPNTKQLGDVTKVKAEDLPFIHLLIGGSPCQGFSFAGKQLNFDDPRSALFFEYVRLLNGLKVKNPNLYFLLENVKMKKEFEKVITDLLGVEPIEINSAIVSAQNRKRLYWTNIQGIEQPEDKNIVLKDIIEHGETDGDKSYCLDASYHKIGKSATPYIYYERSRRQIVFNYLSDRATAKITKNGATVLHLDSHKSSTFGALEYVKIGSQGPYFGDNVGIRKLTPVECERLQTVPDNYTAGVSDTQRYKMLGNGWTVDVITHILKNSLL